MKKDKPLVAACGLDCEECEIRLASDNPELASRISDWFHRHGSPHVAPENVRCSGCRGDRAKHWSADCWILLCCVDKKGLESCHECKGFPCGKLKEWSTKDARYEHALSRLKEMKKHDENTS
jgi:hypothetical protein